MFVALSDTNCQAKSIDLKVCFHYGQKTTVLTKNVHTDLFLHSKETNNSISGPETLVLVRTGLNGSFKCSTGTEMVFLSIWRCHALHFLLFSSYLWFLQPASERTRLVDLVRNFGGKAPVCYYLPSHSSLRGKMKRQMPWPKALYWGILTSPTQTSPCPQTSCDPANPTHSV